MSTGKKINQRRRYSKEFKMARVKDFESGTFSVGQMSRLYQIGNNVLYRWIRLYSTYNQVPAIIMEVPNSQTEKVKQLEDHVLFLERTLGRKQVELDYHKELINQLSLDGIAVEKKSTVTEPLPPYWNNTEKK